VRKWHSRALHVIGTKNFDETWADFVRAFQSARHPLRWKAEVWASEQAKAAPPPPRASDCDSEPVKLLVGICWHLASLHRERRFFLSSHSAGTLLGMSHDKALRLLLMLCADGVLQKVEQGNEHRANRYRYIGEGARDLTGSER